MVMLQKQQQQQEEEELYELQQQRRREDELRSSHAKDQWARLEHIKHKRKDEESNPFLI